MPGLHTDYWLRHCPCCQPANEKYCRRCDRDTPLQTRHEHDATIIECSLCGHEHEVKERDTADVEMERWDEQRKLERWN